MPQGKGYTMHKEMKQIKHKNPKKKYREDMPEVKPRKLEPAPHIPETMMNYKRTKHY